MIGEESNVLCRKLLDSMLSKQQVEDIDDDRYAHVISRVNSRFAAPITPNEVVSLEFHPSAHYVAYSRSDGSLTIWKLSSSSFARSKKMFVADAMANSLSWDPKETSQFATCGTSYDLVIWNIDDKKREVTKLRTLTPGTKTRVEKCLYDPTGRWLLGLTRRALHLFDIEKDYESLSQFTFEIEDDATAVCWNNSGSHIVLGDDCGKLSVFQIEGSSNAKHVITINAHRSAITSCSIEPWGRFLVTGSDDGTCAIWELSSMCCVLLLDELLSPVCSLDVDSTGKILAVCTADGKVHFHNINSGEMLATHSIKGSSSRPVIKFYPDKAWFILSSKQDSLERHFTPNQYDDLVSLWRAENEKVAPRKANSKKIPKKEQKDRLKVAKSDFPRGSRYNDRFS
ncbi:TEX1 (YNL253W) [Zygosaccharomyces parabailii]|uniref:ZYBA0S14-00386g1_1 n=1 Tax=Zygosaccharomyces bailii (strain CLIB 213 / ATCC 58445 / CBS 680 / BCRC 21525 / NBRC 1098 / NCYC 1416 / NRRL Y-2227) TaxID=1333698 RepID=A0A8J2XB22_ZYGB2|nr:TEX1 (YNL253W) [Zygosaccharomyces parabailii]CDF91759.1 ZYBA0S14-00386g1_1 [Zygosaccharomyces bailii CLIB 213]CDH13372.1 related to Protein TEX1 [Zygosaccharomyces bailii ISA1307]